MCPQRNPQHNRLWGAVRLRGAGVRYRCGVSCGCWRGAGTRYREVSYRCWRGAGVRYRGVSCRCWRGAGLRYREVSYRCWRGAGVRYQCGVSYRCWRGAVRAWSAAGRGRRLRQLQAPVGRCTDPVFTSGAPAAQRQTDHQPDVGDTELQSCIRPSCWGQNRRPSDPADLETISAAPLDPEPVGMPITIISVGCAESASSRIINLVSVVQFRVASYEMTQSKMSQFLL